MFFGGVIIAAKLSDFLCDLSKALTDKTQVCGGLMLQEYVLLSMS